LNLSKSFNKASLRSCTGSNHLSKSIKDIYDYKKSYPGSETHAFNKTEIMVIILICLAIPFFIKFSCLAFIQNDEKRPGGNFSKLLSHS
jgi:hypothetical protein